MRQTIILFFTILLLASCGNEKSKDQKADFEVSVSNEDEKNTIALSQDLEEDIIFYNMLYPIDMGKIIDKKSSFYNSSLINPVNNFSNYNKSTQRALALGVYGADLSYLWVFDQSQQALAYFACIKQLADELGIPPTYIEENAMRAESLSDNIDTLVSLARQAYYDSEKYLLENNQQELAALILLGGWIETLHLATNLYLEPTPKMAGKILSQKYSLSSLMNLVYNQTNSEIIEEYAAGLPDLLNAFDELHDLYLLDYIKVDTSGQTITFKEIKDLNMEPTELNAIKTQLSKIRDQIIN